MNKLDLIIDALDQFITLDRHKWNFESVEQALAAARELRGMKPVGEFRNVVWCGMDWHIGVINDKKLKFGTKLYALGESND